MIKLYKDNEGDFYILNDDWSGIRISDGYWDNYGSRIPLKEITRITIDNKIGHFFEPLYGNRQEDRVKLEILIPKNTSLKDNTHIIPYFIYVTRHGYRLISNEKVLSYYKRSIDTHRLEHELGAEQFKKYINKYYKPVDTIKLKKSHENNFKT